jgi:hypothetical protein
MAHGRKQIRDAVAAAISTNGVAVETNRVYPTDVSQLPRYLVFTDSENVDTGESTRQGMMRLADVTVEVVVAETVTHIDDTVDAHAVYIESMLNLSRLGGLAQTVFLQRTNLTTRSDADRSLAVLALTFAVRYRTLPTDPSVIT